MFAANFQRRVSVKGNCGGVQFEFSTVFLVIPNHNLVLNLFALTVWNEDQELD